MKYNREELIEEFLKTPILVGQRISIQGDGNGSQNKLSWGRVTVSEVDGDTISFTMYNGTTKKSRHISEIKRDTSHIGKDPFAEYYRIDFYRADIDCLIQRVGYKLSRLDDNVMPRFETIGDKADIPECNFDAMVVDANGNEVVIQRDLCWNYVQKRALIDSIYNGIDIGKFVIRRRPFKWVEDRVKNGKLTHTAFCDLIDGKQRITAIIDFINNEFTDSFDNYWSDLSAIARAKFIHYANLSFCELPDNTTDKMTMQIFLNINFSGVSMSQEHIDFVRKI